MRITTPAKPLNILTSRNIAKPKEWWSEKEEIQTEFEGLSFDQTSVSIQIMSKLLNAIPIIEENPTVDLSQMKEELNIKLKDYIPHEITMPKDLTEFFTKTTGSYFLKSVKNKETDFVVDFSYYETFEVKKGYEKYGGKIFFKNNEITKYEYLGITFEPDNKFIQLIVRATLCLKMMVEIHALRLHICTAQKKAFEFRRKYPANHPLIDILYLMTYGVFEINRQIPLLIYPNGIVHRLFALTEESYQKLLKKTLTLKGEFKNKEIYGEVGTPWHFQMIKYFSYVEKLMKELIFHCKNKTNTKPLIRELANFFIISSALHNQFGDAQIYSMTISGFFLPKVYSTSPGKLSSMDQNLLYTLLVVVSPRFPLIVDSELGDLFQNPEHQKIWKNFAESIKKAYSSEQNWFNPLYFETSVGF